MMALEAYWAARSSLLPAAKLPAIERQWAFWSHKKNGKANVQIDIDAIRRDVNDWSLDYAGVLVSPHGLRHYFVTAAVKAGLNIKTVKELARHAQISVTGGYVDLNDTDLDRGYDAIFNKGVRNKAEFEKAMQEQK
jgi:site-specific recombinase XerD